MHTLRNSKLIAKLVLVWFALFLGSAIASTVIKPDSLQMVCTASGGMKMVDMTGDDGELKASASMDCPLCAHATPTLPPPTVADLAHVPDARSHILQRLPEAVLIARTAPPLPSRGPPVFN